MYIKANCNLVKYKAIASFLFLVLAVHNGYAKDKETDGVGKSKNQTPLLVTLNAQKVQIGVDGKETFSKADKVKPGDVIQYNAIYRNRSKTSIKGLNASLPIPVGMEYIRKSAKPTSVLASIDDVKYEAEPLMRSLIDEENKSKQIEVAYHEYRSLRWTVGSLDAGKKVDVSARMRVNELPKTPAELVANPTAIPIKP
jgi:uncharacterized repeat protein (TIGR01451 family)